MRKRKKGLNMHKISRKINPKVRISPVYSLLLPSSELMQMKKVWARLNISNLRAHTSNYCTIAES